MSIPYKSTLRPYKGLLNIVVIDRDGAGSVSGCVTQLTDDGVTISTPESQRKDDDVRENTFIDFKDIRGVTASGYFSD